MKYLEYAFASVFGWTVSVMSPVQLVQMIAGTLSAIVSVIAIYNFIREKKTKRKKHE